MAVLKAWLDGLVHVSDGLAGDGAATLVIDAVAACHIEELEIPALTENVEEAAIEAFLVIQGGLKVKQGVFERVEPLLDARTWDAVDGVDDQRVKRVGLTRKVGQTCVGHLLAVGDVQEAQLSKLSDVSHHFICDGISAAWELDVRELRIFVKKKLACSRQKAEAVCQVDALKFFQIFENLGEDRICDEFHATQREHHQIWCHTADVLDHVILDPVVVLKVEAQSFLTKELAQVFLVQNSAWHTFQILNFLPVWIFIKLNIVELFDFSVAKNVLLLWWVFAKVNGLRVQGAMLFSLWIHFCEHLGLFFIACSC